ncbi:MAG: site-specific DNA-methyltransferase [Lewinellaceae bacterium]|nr:site-specific DNA-methyltransferase [Lewinellaceae bacterium]
MAKSKSPKQVEAHTHKSATRKNIPSAEHESVVDQETKTPVRVAIQRRNPDLDPQLVWRGKDAQDWSELVVDAPPLYIQERIHPKHLIDDLQQQSEARKKEDQAEQLDLFADFNGLPSEEARTEFYQHDAHWSNRMILGDSLQVMASLAEREGLRGKVQCIYFDPPYGMNFNSNFQWSVNDRNADKESIEYITRESEQVKAFRDTWKHGIHSYLNYLRDRLTVARELLKDTGNIFIQIGDENVHRVRAIADEVFGEMNFVSQISIQTTSGFRSDFLGNMSDFVLWYVKDKDRAKTKINPPFYRKDFEIGRGNARWLMFEDFTYRGVNAREKRGESAIPKDSKPYKPDNIISQGRSKERQPFEYQGKIYDTWEKNSHWKANYPQGMERLKKAGRIHVAENSIQYIRYHNDFELGVYGNIWSDTGTGNFTADKVYVVQTGEKVIQRCISICTDPGDLVPTCGSGTTAYVAEQWGRRWITIDTSRVALALARARLMGARYPYYLLADSKEGQLKEAEVTRTLPKETPTYGHIRHGFVYERVPHITLKSIANNAEIDVIYDHFQEKLEPLRAQLNEAMGKQWEEWEIPRELREDAPAAAKKAHAEWWKQRIARQKEMDASIAARADFEYLYDKPYEDKTKIRVAGPFTVESLSPHRMLGVDEDGEPFDQLAEEDPATYGEAHDFARLILHNLEKAGVQQMDKQDRITFDSLTPWPGHFIHAEGRYAESDGREKRAGILIGPEYGSVSRADLVEAAREAGDAGFDLLIACAFNYDAHSAEFTKLGRIPVLKARMNADLHMATDLAATGAGNLFVVFGEPDVELIEAEGRQLQVKVNGIDIFDPKTGKVRSDDTDGIACWFVDTNYNGEMFFVRHAYFLGANDPYQSLKRSLKAEVDEEAWQSLYGDTSRPFDKPETGRIAVKIINHLGDEVMKVMRVE